MRAYKKSTQPDTNALKKLERYKSAVHWVPRASLSVDNGYESIAKD